MGLTIVTPAASSALTTKDLVKAELSSPSSDDQIIERLIQDASDAIVRACRRPFALATYGETVAGYGDVRLMLARTPIVAVTSVLCDSSPITDYTIDDAEAGLLFRRNGWAWSAGTGWDLAAHPRPGSEEARFAVTYSAGYVLVGEGRTLPYDVERACKETVKHWYRQRNRDATVESKRVGDLSINYGTTLSREALPPIALRLLKPWRRWD